MERIHVSVRARPISLEDAKTSPWKISGNSIFIPSNPSKFEFDRIFGDDRKTVEVYEARTRDIVTAAVRGFNGTVFAYGQTNSGKTHTMRGSSAEPGVIPLAVHDLFDIIHQDEDREFLLRMSYLEIYNEEINDLLAPEHRKLQIHENLERGIYVAGLREEIVASPQQVLELMEYGESHRHIGETNMNLYSSRSHTIFRMIIESKTQEEDNGSACDAVRVSVLNLVDLAGSERAAKTGAEGVRLKEGSHINKSLMTLGTVIKKLSEGVEGQGGHVPYRDSKLTRILQPALGGNANTAIICNITLAQIHADETKSTLQFASRALRVTNCAHVNEILTDAALLKRQKKEIEELRAKLQGSHSEYLQEEILNLRNTLLKSELERERIALELEEEKKSQAQREKVLKEQAKKIENLSSMVLYSNRDEKRDHVKKDKRRDTWCPGKLSRESLQGVHSSVRSRDSTLKSVRSERYIGPLLPFEELVNENVVKDEPLEQEVDSKDNLSEDCALPTPCALLHVTNRRKVPVKKRNPSVDDNELDEMQTEYEDLLLKYETERTENEILIKCLQTELDKTGFLTDTKYNEQPEYHERGSIFCGDKNVNVRDSEAILVIKHLQEKISMLEMEKSSSQQNLENLVEIATEQNICAREKLAELQEEILFAKEDAKVAREQLISKESAVSGNENFDSAVKLAMEVNELISEAQISKAKVESILSLVDEALQGFSAFSHSLLEFTSFTRQSSMQQASIISSHEKVQFCMQQNVIELENEKLLLQDQSAHFQSQIEELSKEVQKHKASLRALSEQHDLQSSDFLSCIQSLEKEISNLSSCSLAKEKENLRKDLEKTKMKLKETESKLKNAIQDKTKLEGEKACAEREVKRLHGQMALLERDISKRESLAGRRRDSVAESSSKVFDPTRGKASCVSSEQMLQADYKKLEVFAFEMETKIASLLEKLADTCREKEEAICRNEDLASEIVVLSEKLDLSNSELRLLQNEVMDLKIRLEEASSDQQRLETSSKLLLKDKEELAMQLVKSLMDMEEEKAIWRAKEKASIGAIEEKARLYNADMVSLSQGMCEVKELESCRAECLVLVDRLKCSEEEAKQAKIGSMEKSLKIDQLQNDLRSTEAENKQSQEVLKSDLEALPLELQRAREKLDILQTELNSVISERQYLLIRVEELNHGSNASNQLQEEARNSKEKAKLRMRLRGTQAQLDAIRNRYKQCVEDSDLMNRKFEEASANLKERLASKALEVLDLKKQLASATRTMS